PCRDPLLSCVIGSWETKVPQSFAPTVNCQFKGIFLAVQIHRKACTTFCAVTLGPLRYVSGKQSSRLPPYFLAANTHYSSGVSFIRDFCFPRRRQTGEKLVTVSSRGQQSFSLAVRMI